MADDKLTRRDFVRKGTAAGLAATVVASTASASESEEVAVRANEAAVTEGGTLANGMPYGTIGELKISRLILGSNTPGAHSREKTFHNDNYWSATPKEYREPFCWYNGLGGNSYTGKTNDHNRFHDNIWCLDPEKTIEVMRKVEVPWIAFKVLAAGAIHPKQGFGFAFRNGADFIAVGMPDFYVKGNAAIVKSLVTRLKDRDRPWQA